MSIQHVHKLESDQENKTSKFLCEFEKKKNGSPNPNQESKPSINLKKRTSPLMNFSAPANYKVKVKESKLRENTWILLES